MVEMPPSYLLGIANQLMSVSAFLGGFAATFLGTLLYGCPRSRTGSVTIALSALSSSSFIISVLALAALAIQLRPDAPAAYATAGRIADGRALGLLGFVLGIYSLLGALGLSGWTRSRRVGVFTSAVAAAAALLATRSMIS